MPAVGKILITIGVIALGTSCYRMPCNDEYSVIPMTNNRDLTGDTGATPGLPNIHY